MRVNQNGSITSFVVIGVILALSAISLFYWVGHGLRTPSSVEPEVKISAPTTPEKTPAKETPSNDTATPDDTSAKSDDKTETDSQTNTTPPSVDELSQTGPTETYGALVVIGLLVGVSVAYIRSRRLTSSL